MFVLVVVFVVLRFVVVLVVVEIRMPGNQSYCNEIFVIKKIMTEDLALSSPRFFQVAHQ